MTANAYSFLADLVLVLHLGFVLFVLFGAWLALRWMWIVWLHIPAALWGAAIEFGGWICPLTPLENALRRAAGGAGYSGGFVEHYLLPLIYPAALTRTVQLVLGSTVLAVNLLAYGVLYWRHSHHWARTTKLS